MKKIIAFVACFFTLSTLFAQKALVQGKNDATNLKKLLANKRCAITGEIKDMHNFPLKGVEAFIYYQADSSIAASGFTDSEGRFETNSVLPGTYDVKIMYLSEKATLITSVTLKPGITPINIKAEPPVADTSMPYSDIASKPIEKKKTKKRAH